MALLKNTSTVAPVENMIEHVDSNPIEDTQLPPATTTDYDEQPVQQPVQQPNPVQLVQQPTQPNPAQLVQQPTQPNPAQLVPANPVSGNALDQLAQQGFEGLAFDWSSFPSISMKNEGHFEDSESHVYGSEMAFYVRSTKKRYVYRAEPYCDAKKDVLFSYDKVVTQNGLNVRDELNKWNALGKTFVEKEYLEALVELYAPGTPFDGEYRILSIPPASKGRFSGHMAKCSFKGSGDPSSVLTLAMVGNKVTAVANPFFPWAFQITTAEAEESKKARKAAEEEAVAKALAASRAA